MYLLSKLVSPDGITVLFNGSSGIRSYTLHSSYKDYNVALADLQDENYLGFIEHIDRAEALVAYGKGKLQVVAGQVTWTGNSLVLTEGMTKYVLRLASLSLPLTAFENFLSNLELNPSYNSRQQLFSFIEHNDITLTEDGGMIFYKKVQDDLYDLHTGRTFRFAPGTIHEMPRNLVDDNSSVGCSAGIHAASLAYAKSFHADKKTIVLLKVYPKDVVSVPHDSEFQKVRACRVHVVGKHQDRKDLGPLWEDHYFEESDAFVDDDADSSF